MYDRQIFYKLILKVLSLQLVFGCLGTIVSWLVWFRVQSTISVVIGCAIAFIPSLIYALAITLGGFSAQANIIWQRHKRGIVWRFIATIIMFIVVYKFLPQLNLWLLLSTYIISLNAYWIALVI